MNDAEGWIEVDARGAGDGWTSKMMVINYGPLYNIGPLREYIVDRDADDCVLERLILELFH